MNKQNVIYRLNLIELFNLNFVYVQIKIFNFYYY